MLSKNVYLFQEGNAGMRELLGGKGANLAEMTNIGLPVPPGFTVSTAACREYFRCGQQLWDGLRQECMAALADLETVTGKRIGDKENPLLVSVRSGSVFSMPGMMDTVLNLGLNQETVEGLATVSGNPRFAYDCYRRFIQMFADVVLKVERYHFERALEEKKHELGVKDDTALDAAALQALIARYLQIVTRETKQPFPQDPLEQLMLSVRAVFDSWYNQRAMVYRQIHRLPDHLGTAVNVQVMVFGNMGEDSGTGVAFTRNPSNGNKELYGEFLINAQGEDVVAGTRTPLPIAKMNEYMPALYQQFVKLSALLENHYRDLQDIEFTVERGTLYLLQTRNGKRTAAAAVKTAVNMAEEGLLSRDEALLRVNPAQLDHLLHRRIDPDAILTPIARGLPASPGAASGQIVFDADETERLAGEGVKVILVRPETTPDDIHGIVAAQGILTSRGGMTSHAAVVARGMGKSCVTGSEEINIDLTAKTMAVNGLIFHAGDIISIDGSSGEVYAGSVPMIDPELSSEFTKLLAWADEVRMLGVRANADTPDDAIKAREFGAAGIGLCRTEHMFMSQDRLPVVQEMILAKDKFQREKALEKLLPMQQGDFEGIFAAMAGLPVTIRLLDPPLHEFLPNLEDLLVEVTLLKERGKDPQRLREKEGLLKQVRSLHEFNPMLGHRGCRLGIATPEIYRMQTLAIFRAAAALISQGTAVIPEVMIPLVGHEAEIKLMRELVTQAAEEVMRETGISFAYQVGTMIELPRACVTAEQIAASADFFSFGTNDLTQTTLGYSRDDAEGKFLLHYLQQKILPENPFAVLDREGVGALVKIAVEKGRSVKPELKLGICGEHGGDPSSIEFCHLVGLDYVSCSPYRVPVARLAAAHARLKTEVGGQMSDSSESAK
ncbi:MAG: pyruvate, phosphate dikinase [Dethiobacter sp.]|jgi:pyruvate,orthophosphate dikinase|nr:pyruvate, phosphate dikinase [Dethiobacter sp.]MBS3899274.1 pyruvate, phosphate dikinase [Dethiobacter sp.]